MGILRLSPPPNTAIWRITGKRVSGRTPELPICAANRPHFKDTDIEMIPHLHKRIFLVKSRYRDSEIASTNRFTMEIRFFFKRQLPIDGKSNNPQYGELSDSIKYQ